MDLSAEKAAVLAAETFPELIQAPGSKQPELPRGTRIGGYIDDYSAIIEPTEAAREFDPSDPPPPGGVVVSAALPLRTENEDDRLRPIDTSLVENGPGYEQRNALVEVKMPRDLASGIKLAGTGLALQPHGAAAADEVEVVADKAVYANLGGSTDTDFIAAPMPAGFQFMLQLRSEDSPAEHRVDVGIPPAARLISSEVDPGGIDVVERGRLVGTVSAPIALDAAGRQVPVEMRASGEGLTIELSRLDAGWEFPVLVDPVYDYYGWRDSTNPGGYPTDLNGWFTASNHYGKFTGYFLNGVHSRSNPSTIYPHGSYHEWLWQAPPYSFVERVDMYNADHFTLPQDPQIEENLQGIWGRFSSGWWQSGGSYVRGGNDGSPVVTPPTGCQPANWSSPYGYSWDYSHYSMDHWVGSACEPDWYPHVTWGPDAEGEDRNEVVFGLMMHDSGSTLRQCCARAHLRGAFIYLYDRYAPQMTSAQPSPAATWVDDSGNSNHVVNAAASDTGLGMKRFDLHVNHGAGGSFQRYHSATAPCAGDRSSRCPAYYSSPVTYQLPEGRNTVELIPIDIVGWWPKPWQTWTERIDRSAPAVPAPTGSLTADAARVLPTRGYTLTMSATDGSKASAQSMRSGVTRLEAFVDAETSPRYSSTQVCTDVDGSCAMSSTWQLEEGELEDLAPGQHTIRIVATDALGHKAERTLPITLRDDPDEAAVAISAGTPGVDGSYQLTVTASDSPVGDGYSSGVERLEVYMDGELLDAVEQQCGTGSCPPLTWSRQMSATQSLALHRASAVAYDRAGNASLEYRGTAVGRDYEYFGYQDEFLSSPPWTENFNLAVEGGANILRFPVNWCAIEPTQGTYVWQDDVFDRVRAYNLAHPGPEAVATLPVLFNAPTWARESTSSKCDPDDNGPGQNGPIQTVPPARTDAGRAAWSSFVSAFVSRYGPGGPHDGNLVAIEAWNEPNLATFWGAAEQDSFNADPHRFAELVNLAGDASTTVPVLPGGLATANRVYDNDQIRTDDNPGVFMRRVAERLDPNKIDGLSLHLYANKAANTRKANGLIQARYEEIREALPAGRFRDLDRWITEIGFPSDGTGAAGSKKGLGYATEPKQHQRIRNAWHAFASKAIVKAFIVYRLRDVRQSANEPAAVDGDPVENGRFGVVHRAQVEGGAKKWVYCWLEQRGVQRVGVADPQCEPKRPPKPHG